MTGTAVQEAIDAVDKALVEQAVGLDWLEIELAHLYRPWVLKRRSKMTGTTQEALAAHHVTIRTTQQRMDALDNALVEEAGAGDDQTFGRVRETKWQLVGALLEEAVSLRRAVHVLEQL